MTELSDENQKEETIEETELCNENQGEEIIEETFLSEDMPFDSDSPKTDNTKSVQNGVENLPKEIPAKI